MEDRDLIEDVIDGTLPKIKDIREAYRAEADKRLDEEIVAGKWPLLEGLPRGPREPTVEAATERWLYGAPLCDMAIQFLWAIRSKATDGEFLVDGASMAAASAILDEKELRRATGFNQEHVRPILEKMAEAFLEVVRARGLIVVMIDGQPICLRAG